MIDIPARVNSKIHTENRKGNSQQMRTMIAGTLIIGMSISFLLHFALIGFYKSILIQETNVWLFWLEVAIFVAILGYGIYIVWQALTSQLPRS